MNEVSFSDAFLIGGFNGYRAAIERGGLPWLEVYGGEKPDAGAPANAGDLIGIVVLQSPCGDARADGLHLNAASAQATGTGVPIWSRLRNGAGEWMMDGDSGAGGVFAFALSAGQTIYPGGDLIMLGGVIGY